MSVSDVVLTWSPVVLVLLDWDEVSVIKGELCFELLTLF